MTRGASDRWPHRARALRSGGIGAVISLRRLKFERLENRRLLATVSVDLDDGYTPTGLLVQFRPETQYAASLGAYRAGSVVGSPWEIAPGMREVQLANDAELQEALAAFRGDPHVLFAEPDYRVRLSMLPDDPKFASDQWHLNNTGQIEQPPGSDINAPAAWDVTLGSRSVIVAVIDTGVDYNHPDLAANMWQNDDEIAANGIDDDNNGYVDDIYGYDFVNRDGDPMDDHLHGTHIAGTIAAVANNGIGVAGVAPGVRIMALKFLDSKGNGLTSDAISALNYAVANGASISNNSFGGGPISQAFQTAIQNALGANHIFVAAAGNYATNIDSEPFYPASYEVDNIITVAATDAADHLAWFSNYGKRSVDLGAPGIDIYSTFPTTVTAEMLDRGITEPYGTMSGTSMAAPVVAGVLALVRSENDGLSAREVIDQVLATVDRSPALVGKTVSGGRVNAAGALGQAPVDEILPHITASTPAGPTTPPISQVQLTFSEPIDAGSFAIEDVISFLGPLGAVPVLSVEPVSQDGKKFAVVFEPQTEPGQYELLISPHITDLAGNELDNDGDGAGGVDGADDYLAVFQLAAPLPNLYPSEDVPSAVHSFDPIISYLVITDDLPIADLNVHVDLAFPVIGDLHIWLVSPAGTTISLAYRHGGEGQQYFATIFDDEAELAIAEGQSPFAGSFRPDDALALLDEENAQGTWQLVIQNVSETPHEGVLNAWALEIVRRESTGSGGGGETNEPPVAVDDAVTAFQGTPIVLAPEQLLANDTDPNDDPLSLEAVRNPVGGSVVIDEDGQIVFVPSIGNLGVASFEYVITDGEHTAIGTVLITLRSRFSLHNGYDVNADGFVTAFDALLVINYLNAYGAGPIIGLGTADVGITAQTLFYDVVADNVIAASDSLGVINFINAVGPGPVGASLSLSSSLRSDSEGPELAAIDELFAWDGKRKKWF